MAPQTQTAFLAIRVAGPVAAAPGQRLRSTGSPQQHATASQPPKLGKMMAIEQALTRASAKMAVAHSRGQHSQPSSSHILSQGSTAMEGERDGSLNEQFVSTEPQDDLLAKFNKLLQKAGQQTSKQITEKLLSEMRERGHRTAELKAQMDDMQGNLSGHNRELEALREDNLVLHAKIDDAENKPRRVNLRIRGIPETVTEVLATSQ